MRFSYNWLQSFFNKKLPNPEKLAELLSMQFAEVEEVKPSSSRFAYAREVEGIEKKSNDFVLDIDIKPNRASDCFSHFGIAREISAITRASEGSEGRRRNKVSSPIGLSYKEQPDRFKENKNKKGKDFISIDVKDKNDCFRYSAKVIENIKVGSSPKWIQERLISCGLRPINNIVDISNYVMLETGQPLHAFDVEKIEGAKIIVRRAKKGEKIVTLEEKEYNLDEDILVIADTKRPIGIAGIKGEKFSGISEKTKTIVLEAANFNSQVIRNGSRKLKLRTDASSRFEHGIDLNLTEKAINRACYLLQKIAKGKPVFGLADYYPIKVFPKKIKLDLDYAEKLLGIKIPKNEVIKILKSLGFKIIGDFVEAPTWRLDISIQEDLIEEIGRIYGYEKIPEIFPISALIPPKRNLDIFWQNMAKDILKQAGFFETWNYSFSSEKEAEIFGYQIKELIELKNPLSKEHQYLRTGLIPGLLKNIESNFRQFPNIKIFEMGKIFINPRKEKRMLTGVITGDAFFEAKGIVDLLLNKMGISDIYYDNFQATPEESKLLIWHPKKCAEIKINGREIGFLGEISLKIISKFNFKEKVVLFDIDFDKLSQFASEEQEYQQISRYPAAVRDIAVLVPREVKVEEVLNKIETTGGKLIRDIDLFDIYEGEQLPEGKKNLAFHIIYQANDRTLTSGEIDEIQNKIIRFLEEEKDWEVRR